MKIRNISLNDYNQFKKLDIDLTYPKGHAKEGQPLDKICFIGQSGTGKTSLLRLIKFCTTHNKQIGDGIYMPNIESGQVTLVIDSDVETYACSPSPEYMNIGKVDRSDTDEWFEKWQKDRLDFIKRNKPILINFPTERITNKDNKVLDLSSITQEHKAKREQYLENLRPGDYIDFSFENSSKAWDLVLSDIKKHQAEELIWKQQIADVAIKLQSKPDDVIKINNKYQKWLQENPNPLDQLAEKMDVILHQIGMKIKTDVDRETILHLGNILLQTLDGKDVSRDFWSTGTKQIIDTAVPLIEINPKNAIVLIDEPERSLYPNLQQKIIDFYTSIGTNCQFFFATHSPIIASAFDPWEIVELKFDESNTNVIQETNYSGERTIDNYKVFPKYLDWKSILMKLFDLTEEGSSSREAELLKLVSLKNELELLKKNGKNKGTSFTKKLNNFISLKQKVGWDEKAR